MPSLQIICLANSRKYQGRCVAGLRTDGRGWVRPVGHGLNGTLLPEDYTLQDGSEPQVLDMLNIDVAEPCPEPHQPENWLIGKRPWRLVSRPAPKGLAPRLLKPHITPGPELFGDAFDRIPSDSFSRAPAKASLALVTPTDLQWRVVAYSGRRKVRGCFTLGGTRYDLGLTDPNCEQGLCELPPGTYPLSAAGFDEDERPLLTISLGEPFGDDPHCFKLVAAVIAVPQLWWQ